MSNAAASKSAFALTFELGASFETLQEVIDGSGAVASLALLLALLVDGRRKALHDDRDAAGSSSPASSA